MADLNTNWAQDEIYLQVIKTSGDGAEKKYAASVLKLLKRGKHWVLVTLLLGNVITNETLPIVLDRSLGGGWPAILGSTALIGLLDKAGVIDPELEKLTRSSDLWRNYSSVNLRSLRSSNRRVDVSFGVGLDVHPCTRCVAYRKTPRQSSGRGSRDNIQESRTQNTRDVA